MALDKHKEAFKSISTSTFDKENGFSSKFFMEDPSYLHYSLFIDMSSPLLNPVNAKGESAERYFKRRGDKDRVNAVIDFRDRLINLLEKTPYLMRSINGLENILDYNAEQFHLERELEIETYETTDQRINSLAKLYTFIVYDWKYNRKMLPDNLEWINIQIIINDCRNLVKFVDSGEQGELVSIDSFIPTTVLDFYHSAFDFTKSFKGLNGINNSEPTVLDNSFRIKTGKFTMKSSNIKINSEELSKSIVDYSNPAPLAGKKTLIQKGVDAAIELGKKEAIRLRQEPGRLRDDATTAATDRIKAKAFELANYNVHYRGQAPEPFRLITGQQSSGQISPDFRGNEMKEILDKDKVKSLSEDYTKNQRQEIINSIINKQNLEF